MGIPVGIQEDPASLHDPGRSRFLPVSKFRIDKTGCLRKLRSVSSLSLTPASYRWDEWKAWLSPLAAAVLSWYRSGGLFSGHAARNVAPLAETVLFVSVLRRET